MKIVFLDFDGVLNSVIYDRERDKSTNTNIDESRVCLLKQIIDETNAKIVLSTSWRRHWDKNIEPKPPFIGFVRNMASVFADYVLDPLDPVSVVLFVPFRRKEYIFRFDQRCSQCVGNVNEDKVLLG